MSVAKTLRLKANAGQEDAKGAVLKSGQASTFVKYQQRDFGCHETRPEKT